MRQVYQDEYGQAYEKIECPRCKLPIKIEQIKGTPSYSPDCYKIICDSCCKLSFNGELSSVFFDAPEGYQQYHEPRPRLGIDVAKD